MKLLLAVLIGQAALYILAELLAIAHVIVTTPSSELLNPATKDKP